MKVRRKIKSTYAKCIKSHTKRKKKTTYIISINLIRVIWEFGENRGNWVRISEHYT